MMDLRRTLDQPCAFGIEQRRTACIPAIGRPSRLLQAGSHGLAIQLQLPRDRGDRLAGSPPLLNDLPLLLADQACGDCVVIRCD